MNANSNPTTSSSKCRSIAILLDRLPVELNGFELQLIHERRKWGAREQVHVALHRMPLFSDDQN